MLGASPPAPANAASVQTTPTRTITPPPRASVVDTAVSNGVAKLKCEGTPRHACMLISTVSTTQVAMNTPSTRPRAGRRRYEVAHATEGSVRPNESPNVAALRSDTGPIHVHPVTSRMPTCTRPLTNSTRPTT